ncbi:MAG: undecaprenyl/decaprenyl-phosphate alpha-N-acetylglucosaminyl 1-phosphate transferase [Pseudomonadota bacterium]|nr:undecaprenyl/decaprenyl-phosphate alpha-N-acetylglucosaminyl 1-phosphate transferase [Pseudomonadota bacterium]
MIGGIAMFGGLVCATVMLPAAEPKLGALLAASALLVIIGLWDDYRGLSVRTRFAVQIGAALLMIYWVEVSLHDLGDLFWPGATFALGLCAVPFTVFCTVGVINAMNMVDGLDGLAGGIAGMSLLLLAWAAFVAGLYTDVHLLLVAAGVVFTFLCFNLRFPWRRRGAKVFMGNAGSMFLGLILAWFLIRLSQGELRAFTPVTALYLFGLPLLDMFTLTVRRIVKHRSPFAADREHLHHLLMRAGYSVNQSVMIMWGLALGLGITGLAGLYFRIAESVMFYTFLGLCSLYFYATTRAIEVMKVIEHRVATGRAEFSTVPFSGRLVLDTAFRKSVEYAARGRVYRRVNGRRQSLHPRAR